MYGIFIIFTSRLKKKGGGWGGKGREQRRPQKNGERPTGAQAQECGKQPHVYGLPKFGPGNKGRTRGEGSNSCQNACSVLIYIK